MRECGITTTTGSGAKSSRYGAAFAKNCANAGTERSSCFAVPSGRQKPIVASLSIGWYGLMFQAHSMTPAPRPAKAYANLRSTRFAANSGVRQAKPSRS